MLTSASASRGGAACAAMAATAIVMFSGWSAPADGIDIPGIGHDDSASCAASSSDPNARSSCNQRGHNGTDGRDGAVHRDGGDDSGSSTHG